MLDVIRQKIKKSNNKDFATYVQAKTSADSCWGIDKTLNSVIITAVSEHYEANTEQAAGCLQIYIKSWVLQDQAKNAARPTNNWLIC